MRGDERQELEDAIATDPQDPNAYLVYADWLQARGDPLGELIVVQHAMAARPRDEHQRLKEREQELLDAHGRTWLASLPDFEPSYLDWQWGFIAGASFGTHLGAELVAALAEAPAARFIQSLELYVDDRPPRSAAWDDPIPATDPLKAMAEIGLARSLRRLHFGAFTNHSIDERVVDLEVVYPSWQTLHELHLDTPASLGRMELARLRILGISSYSAPVLDELAAARLPSLERLELWTNGDFGTVERIPIRTFPRLRELCLGRQGRIDAEDVRLLAEASWLRDLRGLDLLSVDGRALLARIDRFAHLEGLTLHASNFSTAEQERLREIFGDRVALRA